jgi:ubiquinone/menaquinone biosynthesis C-methylase UbiE
MTKRVDFSEYYNSRVQQHLFRWVDAAKIRILRKELACFTEDDVAIDLGSGAGAIPAKLGGGIICVDGNVALAKICKSRGLTTVAADLDKGLPFQDKSVSAAILIDVIEHVKHPDALIKELKRVLKDDGKLMVFTPAYDSIPWLIAEQVHHILTKKKSDHISPMTREALEYLMAENFSKYRVWRINFLLGLVAVVN